MANSEYEYTRHFETHTVLLPQCYILIRLDGRSFHHFSQKYSFSKPNDLRALELMNAAAVHVMQQLPDILLAYGQSDEMSFVLAPGCRLYDRRSEKIVSSIVSLFTGAYCLLWSEHFPPELKLTPPYPSFDGRAVCYPSLKTLRDYLAWRQVDCHVNNLYNTAFWALVEQGGVSHRAAEEALKGTLSAEKNEMLWGRFGVNYNGVEEVCRKGSVIFRDVRVVEGRVRRVGDGVGDGGAVGDLGEVEQTAEADHEDEGVNGGTEVDPGEAQVKQGGSNITESQQKRQPDPRLKWKTTISIVHEDIIKDTFWRAHPWFLETGTARKRAIRTYFSSKYESKDSRQDDSMQDS